MVPGAGVEPAWSYLRGILSPLCLPISPPGRCILWCPGRESNPHATRTLEPKSSLSTSSNTWARRRIVRSSCRRGNRPRLLLSWIWLKSLSGIADYFSVRRVAFNPSGSARVDKAPFIIDGEGQLRILPQYLKLTSSIRRLYSSSRLRSMPRSLMNSVLLRLILLLIA